MLIFAPPQCFCAGADSIDPADTYFAVWTICGVPAVWFGVDFKVTFVSKSDGAEFELHAAGFA